MVTVFLNETVESRRRYLTGPEAPRRVRLYHGNLTSCLVMWDPPAGSGVMSYTVGVRFGNGTEVSRSANLDTEIRQQWLHDFIPGINYTVDVAAFKKRRFSLPVRVKFPTDSVFLDASDGTNVATNETLEAPSLVPPTTNSKTPDTVTEKSIEASSTVNAAFPTASAILVTDDTILVTSETTTSSSSGSLNWTKTETSASSSTEYASLTTSSTPTNSSNGPDSPLNLTVECVNSTTSEVHWDKPPIMKNEVPNYVVSRIANETKGAGASEAVTSEQRMMLYDLVPKRNHTVRVTSIYAGRHSVPSEASFVQETNNYGNCTEEPDTNAADGDTENGTQTNFPTTVIVAIVLGAVLGSMVFLGLAYFLVRVGGRAVERFVRSRQRVRVGQYFEMATFNNRPDAAIPE